MLSGGTLSACAMAGTAVFRIVVSNDSMKKPTATSHGRRRLAVWLKVTVSRACKAIERLASVACERRIHDALRLGDQPVQMPGAMKALGVDLVDILGSRRPRGEPTATRGDLHAADGCIVPRSVRQNLIDRLAGEFRDPHLLPVELAELFLLLRVCRGVHAIGVYRAQFLSHGAVRIAGIPSRARRDLRRQKRRHQAVLVCRPDAAVESAERGAGAFLAAEAQTAVHQTAHEPFEAHRDLVQGPAEP